MRMLLVAAAASLLLISAPPLTSAGFFRLPPKIGLSPAGSQQFGKTLKDFARKHGDEVADVVQNLLPPPPPPGEGGSDDPGRIDNAPAETTGLYLASLLVGTPEPQTISGILDISTQLVWMQCATCPPACPTPPSFYFQTTYSKTLNFLSCTNDAHYDCQSLIPQQCGPRNLCNYYTSYSKNTVTTGSLASDAFTFDDGATAVRLVFGCSNAMSTKGDYSGASGVIGLGRGPLSLVSQLQLSNFSYLLAPYGDSGSQSQVQLGGVAVPQKGRIRSTPLHASAKYSNLYYVQLTGIHVDGEELHGIPPGTFEMNDDGSGGVFLSTTVAVTYLLSDAYKVVREAFASKISQTSLESGIFDPLCYTAESMDGVTYPRLTLVFQGNDATMELRAQNYFLKFNDGERDLDCLSILPSQGASILGSLLQTGTTMIYDLNPDGEQLTFVTPEDASPSSPSPSQAPLGIPEARAASLPMVMAAAMWALLLL